MVESLHATPEPVTNAGVRNRRKAPKTVEAVVLYLISTGSSSYADMVKEVKATVHEQAISFGITTRRAKSGNVVLEVADKENADKLAEALRTRFLESKRVGRLAPSISLLLIGIEDSIDEKELRAALEAHDSELKAANKLVIREGANGVRTAIAKVPLAPGLRLAAAKKIKIGWSICRVKELVNRRVCVKCKAPGHVAKDCTGQESRKCFRCKKVGHLIAACDTPPPVPLVEDLNGSQGTGAQRNEASAQL